MVTGGGLPNHDPSVKGFFLLLSFNGHRTLFLILKIFRISIRASLHKKQRVATLSKINFLGRSVTHGANWCVIFFSIKSLFYVIAFVYRALNIGDLHGFPKPINKLVLCARSLDRTKSSCREVEGVSKNYHGNQIIEI